MDQAVSESKPGLHCSDLPNEMPLFVEPRSTYNYCRPAHPLEVINAANVCHRCCKTACKHMNLCHFGKILISVGD